MNRSETRCFAIDPGGTTGWSMGTGTVRESYGENDSEEFLGLFFGLAWHGIGRVVIERFDLRQFTDDSKATVELIGVIKWMCRHRDWPYVEIPASEKRKFIDYIRSISLGKPHAADAEALRLYDLEYGQW